MPTLVATIQALGPVSAALRAALTGPRAPAYQQNWYFLVQGQQVHSCLLLNQGGEAYFVDFCH